MVEPLIVYAAEKEAGLEEQLICPGAQAAVSLARIGGLSLPPIFTREDDSSLIERVLGMASDQFDLYPVHSILVSTGWNKNDDIFDQLETWKARHTAVDKPFNLGHDANKIIGHITGSVGIDGDHKTISENLLANDLPDKFHILTRSVIYKHVSSRNEDLQAEIIELIQGIVRNEWFVSMEALFTNFDYGFIHTDGSQQVVARQENTAFLTKHLRRYGGEGTYKGSRLGRVLRNITFSAQGMVRNPANPESVIFNDTDMFKGVLASEKETKVLTGASSIMSEELIRDLKDKCAALEQKYNQAIKSLEEMGVQAVQAKLDAKDREVAQRDEQITSLKSEVAEFKTSVKELKESRDEAVAKNIETEAKLTEAQQKIKTSEAEALKTSRVSILVDKGVEKVKAEELVTEFDGLDDNKFSKLVDIQTELVAAKKTEGSSESQTSEETESEEQETESGSEESSEAETEETLNTAEEEDDPALSTGDSEEQDGELQTSIASYLGKWLSSSKSE